MKKILLIGPYPPPIGGVSIHLERFLSRINNEDSYISSLLDLKRLKCYGKIAGGLLSCIRAFFTADIIHIHLQSNIKLLIALTAKIFNKKIVYTHHNSRIKNSKIFELLVKVCDHIILVNDRELNLDGDFLSSDKISVIPAFLPPVEISPLPEDLKNRISNYKVIVSSNCSIKAEFNGKDLYGFDIIIEAFSNFINSLDDSVSDSILVLVDPTATSKDFIFECLEKWPVPHKNYIIVDYNIDFYSLIKESSVIIRSARTDGDSLSVREALYAGCTMIASDSTWRPEGVITYSTESANELSILLQRCFNDEFEGVVEKEDYFFKIIQVYDSFLYASKVN